jgi:YtkA-like
MRIRPFFWCLLAGVCASMLIFAATIQTHAPIMMQVHLDPAHPEAIKITTLELHLTNQEGMPIEQAQVVPSAWMTNMDMAMNRVSVMTLGQGNYQARLQFSMAGPWEIRVEAQAPGFDPAQQVLFVQVGLSGHRYNGGERNRNRSDFHCTALKLSVLASKP